MSKTLRFTIASIGAVAILLQAMPVAWAATLTWDADTGTSGAQDGAGTWTTGGNDWWDLAQQNWADNDDAVFGVSGTGNYTITLNTGVTANSLTFNSSAPNYTISGTGSITLSGGTITADNSATISSILAGSVGLFKYGTGTLLLSGVNTYTGGTYVNAGTLKAGSTSAFGALGNTLTVTSGAAVDIGGIDIPTGRYSISIAGTGVSGNGAIINSGTSRNNGFLALTLAGDATIGGSGRWDVRGASPGNATLDLGGFTLTKTGANKIAIVNANVTNSGTIDITSGTLTFTRCTVSGTGAINATAGTTLQFENYTSGSMTKNLTLTDATLQLIGNSFSVGSAISVSSLGTFDAASGLTLTATGVISDTGSLTKAGAGTLTLSNTGNSYSGDTIISAGTLRLAAANVIPDGAGKGNVVVNAGTLDLGGFSETINGLSGSGTIDNRSGTGTYTLTIGNNNQTSDFAGTIKNTSGTVAITKTGGGTLTLSGANTYTGLTTINGGTLVLSGTSTTSGFTLNGGTGTTLLVTNAGATGSGNILMNTGVTTPNLQFHIDGGGTIALANSIGGNSGITTTIDVNNNGSGTGGVIQLNGAGANGLGTVTLNITGGNGYSLYIANIKNTAGTAGAITFNPTTASLSLGNLTANQASGTDTWVLGGTATGNSVIGVISDKAGGGAISAVTKNNSSTWTLSGANTYTGATTLNAGTLRLSGGDNRLPTGTTVAFTGTSTLDIDAISQTVSSFTLPDATMTGTISGSGGTLIVNGAANLQIGPGGTLGSTQLITLDMTNLDTFSYDAVANTFRVGLKSGAGNSGGLGQIATATLANDNTIRASVLAVGDVSANSDGGASTLHLGQDNLLKVNSINVGYSGRSDATLDFAAGLTSPAVTIRNTDGTSAVSIWDIGRVGQFAGAGQTTFGATVDLSAGTLDALVTTVRVGSADTTGATNRAGTQNSDFTMGAGTLTAGTLTIGRIAGGGSIGAAFTANGTFTMNNAAGTLDATTINLAENTITASGAFAKTVTGTLNLTDGTIKATAIQLGAQTGTATPTAAFNWTNGTIQNSDGADLSITGVPITLLSGTHTFNVTGAQTTALNSASTISGGSGITKTGTGTLSLSGANTFSGDTAISDGTFVLVGAGSIATSPNITLGNTATFDVSGVTGGNFALASGQSLKGTGTVVGNLAFGAGTVLSPGNSPGTLNTIGTVTYGGGGTYTWEINSASTTFGIGKGVDPGYDWHNITGLLDITATSGNEHVIDITGLNGASPGAVANWDPHNSYQWVLATASLGVNGFNASDFILNTANFADNNALNNLGAAAFTISTSGNDLLLNFQGAGATAYWDINGSTAGAGGATPAGTWSTGAANWNLNSGGTLSTVVWTDGDDAVFAAGTDATGAYTVTISGGVTANSILVEEGTPTITASTLTLSGGTITVNSAATISSSIADTGGVGLTKAGSSVLTLSGANTYSGPTTVNAGRLKILNASALSSTSSVTLNNMTVVGGDGTVLDLSGGITIASTPLIMNSDGVSNYRTSLMSTSGLNTYGGTITLNGSGLTVFNRGGGDLIVSGPIEDGGGFTGTLFVRGGGGTGTITGTINIPTGKFGKTDAGTWQINSTGNSWLWTQVAVGTLKMGATDALPSTATLTMGQNDGNNATLDLNGFSQTVAGLVLSSTGGTKQITSATSATLTVNNTANYSYGGIFSGAVTLAKTGTGTLTLSGANTHTGGTTINSGFLSVSSDGNFGGTASPGTITIDGGTVVTTANITLNANHPLFIGANGGSITGTGNTGFTALGANKLTGAGTLTINGSSSTDTVLQTGAAQSTFTGPININSGRINVNNAAGTLGTGTITVGTGSASLYISQPATLANPLRIQSNGGEGRGAVRFQNGGTAAGDIQLLANAGISTESASTPVTLSGDISGAFQLQLGGLTGSNAGGTYTLSGDNSLNQILVGSGTTIFDGGTWTSSVGAGSRSLNVRGGGTVTVQNGANLTLGGVVALGQAASSAGNLVMTSGTLTINGVDGTGGGRSLIIAEYPTETSTLTISGGHLSVPNGITFLSWDGDSGVLNISGGLVELLRLRTDGAGGVLNLTGGELRLGSGGIDMTSGSQTLNMGGGTVSSSATWSSSRPMTLTGTGGDVTFAPDTGDTITLTGALSGSGGLIKTGNGTLTLSPTASNSYTGGTTVNDGILKLTYANGGANQGTIKGVLTINSGATVLATTSKAIGFASTAIGNVTTINLNDGLLDYTGTNGGLGGGQTVYMTGGTIQSNGGVSSHTAGGYYRFLNTGPDPTVYTLASSSTATIAGRVELSAAGTFNTQDGTATTDLLVSAAITGANGITKAGPGTMELSANNTFTGTTDVQDGTLLLSGGVLNGPVSLAAGATVVATQTTGLAGEYYFGAPSTGSFGSLAALNTLMATQTPDFLFNGSTSSTGMQFGNTGSGFPSGVPTTNYEARWVGQFNAATAGSYVFGLSSDDGSIITIDGVTVVSKGGGGYNGTPVTGSATLTAGWHDITIGYYQGTGGRGFTAYVTPPAGSQQVISDSQLTSGPAIPSISGPAGSTLTLQSGVLTIGPSNDGTFSGTITGAGNLRKIGTGTLTLDGPNTYTGRTIIGAGTLKIDSEARLGGNPSTATADQLEFSGGVLQTTTSFAIDDSNRGITISAGNGTVNTDTGTELTVASNITGAGGLTKEGAGTLKLSGYNNYAGATTINVGTITLGAVSGPVPGSLYWLDAADGATVITSGGSVTAWNDKSGNSRNFTQGTAGNRPSYVAGLINGLPAVRFDGTDDYLAWGSATSPRTVFIVNTPIAWGNLDGIWGNSSPGDDGIRMYSSNNATWRGPSNDDGNDFTYNNGAMYINGVSSQSFGSLGTAHLLSATWGSGHSATYNNTRLGGYFGGRYINANIGEVLAYSTILNASDRQLVEAYLMNKWLGTSINVSAGLPNATTLTVAAGATLDLNGFSQGVGSIAGAGTITDSTASGVTFTTGNNNASTTFSGTIGSNLTLNKVGSGTQTLSSVNTYTGGTIFDAGTIYIGADNNLGDPAGTLTFLGGSLRVSNTFTLSAARPVILSTGGGDINVDAGKIFTIDQTISGTAGLTKNGTSGTLTLNGVNTFTGGVNINGGVIRITNSSALGTGAKTITLSNGTAGHPELHLDGSGGDITLPANMSFTTSWINGVLYNDAGNNTVQGNFNLTSGGGDTTLVSRSGTLTMTGSFTPSTTSRGLRLRGDGAGVISGIIRDGTGANVLVGLYRDGGTGTWALTGNNTYTGATYINAGVLALESSGDINSTSGVNINGGTLRQNSSFALTPTITFGANGGTITGTGVVGQSGNSLVVGDNAVLSPGNSPGAQNYVGSMTWSSGGTYLWEINDWSGTASNNWDFIELNGPLDFAGLTSANPFTIEIVSLTLSNTFGLPANWDRSVDRTFPILHSTVAVDVGFDPSLFVLSYDLPPGAPPYAKWSLDWDGSYTIFLNYTALIPEPTTVVLFGLGGLLLFVGRRVRKQRAR